jgi:hypothetical protein
MKESAATPNGQMMLLYQGSSTFEERFHFMVAQENGLASKGLV